MDLVEFSLIFYGFGGIFVDLVDVSSIFYGFNRIETKIV